MERDEILYREEFNRFCSIIMEKQNLFPISLQRSDEFRQKGEMRSINFRQGSLSIRRELGFGPYRDSSTTIHIVMEIEHEKTNWKASKGMCRIPLREVLPAFGTREGCLKRSQHFIPEICAKRSEIRFLGQDMKSEPNRRSPCGSRTSGSYTMDCLGQ